MKSERNNRAIKFLAHILGKRSTVVYLILFGVGLRLIFLLLLSDTSLRNDQSNYHEVAVYMLNDQDFSPNWPPGLSYYLMAFYSFFGADEFVGRAAMIVLYIAFSCILYALILRVSARWTANVAVILFALFPTYVFHSFEPLTQMPTAFCALGIVYVLILLIEKINYARLAFLGTLLGGITLIRPSSVVLLIFCVVFLFLTKKNAKVVFIPLGIALFIISAWIYKAYTLSDHFVFVNYNNARNLFYGNNSYTPLYRTWWFGSHPEGDKGVPQEYSEVIAEIDSQPLHVRDGLFRRAVVNHISSRPDLFLLRTFNRIRCYLAFDTFTGSFLNKWYYLPLTVSLAVIGIDAVFYLAFLFLALLCFLCVKETSNRRSVMIILWIILLYSLPYWISFSHPTYHFPIVPLLCVLSMISLEQLVTRPWKETINEFISGKRRQWGLIFMAFAIIFVQIEWFVIMFTRI